MQRIRKLIESTNSPYQDFLARTLVSLLAGHYILSHTAKYDIFNVVLANGYAPSLLGSFIIAMLIFYAANRITVALDKHMPYAVNWKKRCFFQFLFGVVGVSLLAFGLAAIYFVIRETPERIPRYYNQDFPIVLAFILCINAYYVIYHFTRVLRKLVKFMLLLLKRIRKQSIKYDVQASLPDRDEAKIAIIFTRSHRRYQAVYTNGSSIPWTVPLRDSLKELPQEEYFMINRSCILNLSAIKCIEQLPSRRYKITLKNAIAEKVPEEYLNVAQLQYTKFLSWIGDRKLWR